MYLCPNKGARISLFLNVLLHSEKNGSWCNGNTPVFGTVIQGSSPCEPAFVFIFVF